MSAGEVLVVDDNFNFAKALAKLIGDAGFHAVACHNGGEALAFAANASLLAVVLDIHLPDLNGLILAQKLRDRLGATLPIIIVSGDTSMETIHSLSHVGASYFFPKPVNAGALVSRLKELVGAST
ncbi:MAG: response regulator [Tepidisphaeraceae bacterium]